MNRRCPSCGDIEKKDEFVKNFCPQCFTHHFQLAEVPEEVVVTRCTVCGRIKKESEWIRENKQALTEIITKKIKSQYSPIILEVFLKERRKGFDTLVDLEFDVDDAKLKKRYAVRIDFEQTQCVDCSRDTGGYFDSIVQLRLLDEVEPKEREGKIKKLESKVKKLIRALEFRGGRLHKVEQVETGFDVYVGGITPAMQASHEVGEKVKHTRKLITRKNGKDLYRHTFCLRF
jgi:nonsense-mediated mRNA decay protein 3